MSTSLLNELMTDHLDGGYAAAASRKAERAAARAPAPQAPTAHPARESDHVTGAARESEDVDAATERPAGAVADGSNAALGDGLGGADGAARSARKSADSTVGRVRGWWGRVAGEGGAGETVEERRTARVVLSAGLLLVGLLFAVSYRGTIRTAPESERARQGLVRDVEAGSALSDSLQRRAETLSGQLVRERDSVLTRTETGERATREVRRLEAAAALVPVTGPGITVSVGDASPQEQVDPSTGDTVSVPADDSGRLRDRDLQSVVNALWAAGAEAISVGGERLAPTTTIRAAGEAILVDLRPVASPYAIEAVGNPDTLLPRFADSDAARRYQSYTGLYGIRFTVTRQQSLSLRAATGPELRYAEPTAPPATSPPTPSPSRSGS